MEAGCGRASEREGEACSLETAWTAGRRRVLLVSPPLPSPGSLQRQPRAIAPTKRPPLVYREKEGGRKGKPGLACPWGGADWKTTARARQKKQLAAGGSRAESREAI